MCESTPSNKEQAKHCFGDLANAFRVLHHYSKQWNEDDIISVLEELTSVYMPCFQAVVRLLAGKN